MNWPLSALLKLLTPAAGSLQWLETEKDIDGIRHTYQEDVNFIVITSPDNLAEAIALFGASRVFTTEQMKGLQAPTVLLYRFFEQPGFNAVSKNMDNSSRVADDNQRLCHSNTFNDLFVASTRAQTTLMIYQPPNRALAAITDPLKHVVLETTQKQSAPVKPAAPVVSSKAAWLEQAQVLRTQGNLLQAQAIEAQWGESLATSTPPNQAVATKPAASIKATKTNKRTKTKKKNKKNASMSGLAALAEEAEKQSPLVVSSEEEQLDRLCSAILNGQKTALEALLNFPFTTLKTYSELTPNQCLAKNLPAVTLFTYLTKQQQQTLNLPAPFLALLVDYARHLHNRVAIKQDAFIALLNYRPTPTTVPLALPLLRALNKEENAYDIIKNYKQQRRNKLSLLLSEGQLSALAILMQLDLINIPDHDGNTPLHIAAACGHSDMVQLLLANGVDTNVVNNEGITPLHVAAYKGHINIVQMLLNTGTDLNVANQTGDTPLHLAAAEGHEEIVKMLLAKDIDVNVSNKKNATPLLWAVKNGHVNIVQMLLNKGANPNIAIQGGMTPLHVAAEAGQDEIVKMLLLAKDIDINVSNEKNVTPLFWAIENGHVNIVQMLLNKGANPNIAFQGSVTPLHWAAIKGHVDIVQMLLDNGADPTVATPKGATPLHFAAEAGHDEIVKMFLAKDIDVNVSSEENVTPLFLAAQNGHESTVQRLLNNGADPTIANQAGDTPLHLAAKKGHINIVQILLDKDANPNVANQAGETPLSLAEQEKNKKIIQMLLARNSNANSTIKESTVPLHLTEKKEANDIDKTSAVHNKGLTDNVHSFYGISKKPKQSSQEQQRNTASNKAG
ncbi:ankyrin repeat domain-containing protein [Legionella sp. D16C41]|uniref:ankyrin repeat domain-containing protein n=1 Tax=Legionella sp. D16C41 TaxID=3402688 RepID=UPI003AF56419